MNVLDKRLIAIAKITKDTDRPILQKVLFRGNKVVATNGYVLAEYNTTKNIPAEEYPLKPFKKIVKSLRKEIMISGRHIVSSVKFLKISNLDCSRKAVLCNNTKNTIEIASTDLEGISSATFIKGKGDGKYPDYKKILKKPKKAKRICLSTKQLQMILDVYKGEYAVNIYIDLEEKKGLTPVYMENNNKDTRSVIMPLRY